jgi:hypothetical protein
MTLHKVFASGSYTGNGSSQTIEIGWDAAYVITVGNKATGPGDGRSVGNQKISTMSSTNSLRRGGTGTTTYTTNGLALTSTGFTVSTNASNENSITYYWYAIRAGAHVDVGTYTGDGSTSPGQAITTGRQPCSVQIIGQNATAVVKNRMMSGDVSYRYATGAAIEQSSGSNGVSIQSDGFTVKGTHGNTSGQTYHYIAQYDIVGSTGLNRCETLVGDGGAGPVSGQDIVLGAYPRYAIGCTPSGGVDVAICYAGGWGSFREGYWRVTASASNLLASNIFNVGIWPGNSVGFEVLGVYCAEMRSNGVTSFWSIGMN